MATMQVDGFEDVIRMLEYLPEKVGSDALRSAANAGASIIKSEVIARAPRKRGILADNIYQKHIDEISSATSQTYHVSWRKTGKSDVPFYGVWVEYGHWYIPPKPDGITWKRHREQAKPIFVAAHPFLRPGYEAKKDAALTAMREKLKERVAEALKGG
ncbi:HK97 gp10 family phage protein [Herbaspirillum huttiense]|uniref:HK97 gp10 family phage protein n=1 Tax=Herbaspirillum huttiense TaxID=863372 RepID=UPI0037FB8FF9